MESAGMPEERKDPERSDLDDALEGLSGLAHGLVGKLLGPRATPKGQGVVVNEDVDKALDDVGSTLGSLLSAAGEAMKEHSTAPDAAVEATVEKVQAGHKADGRDGWSPLVEGASAFAEGFGKMSTDLLDGLMAKDIRPPSSPPDPSPDSEEGDP